MTLALLAQATPLAPDALSGHLTQLALAVLLGINAWQLRVTLQFRDDARTLRQWAFGENGNNGANGALKHLHDRADLYGNDLHAVRGELQVHEIRLEAVERRHGEPDRRHVQ